MKVLVISQMETIIIIAEISHDNLFSLQASYHVWVLPNSPFSGESCLHDTIANSLWKKLLIKNSCIYGVIPPKGCDF